MACGIYTIKRPESDRCYVGSSVNIRNRWKKHKQELRNGTHHSYLLQRAWNKYGEAAFMWTVIEEIDRTHLAVREQYWIDTLSAYKKGYNASPLAYSPTGLKRRPESIQLSAAKRRGAKRTPEQRARMSEGRKKSLAVKLHMETLWAKTRGRPLTPEHKLALSRALKGKPKPPRSPEHCRAISENARRRHACWRLERQNEAN